MPIFKVRASKEVVNKGPEASGKRRRTIATPTGPRILVFGANPVYLVVDELPPELAGDQYLLTTPVDSIEPGGETVDLKAERVQEPDAALIQPPADLKAERVQEDAAAPAPPPLPSVQELLESAAPAKPVVSPAPPRKR